MPQNEDTIKMSLLPCGYLHDCSLTFSQADAVAQAISVKFGVTKAQVLDRETNDNLAVRLALAETQIINDTKKMLEEVSCRLSNFGGKILRKRNFH